MLDSGLIIVSRFLSKLLGYAGEVEKARKEFLGTKTPGRTRRVVRDAIVAFDPRLWEWIDRAVPSPMAYRWLNRYWQRACKTAKVVGVRMYDLRHLSAQIAGDAGVTDRDLTVHLRHATPGMSHRYSRRAVAWMAAERVADGLLQGRGSRRVG